MSSSLAMAFLVIWTVSASVFTRLWLPDPSSKVALFTQGLSNDFEFMPVLEVGKPSIKPCFSIQNKPGLDYKRDRWESWHWPQGTKEPRITICAGNFDTDHLECRVSGPDPPYSIYALDNWTKVKWSQLDLPNGTTLFSGGYIMNDTAKCYSFGCGGSPSAESILVDPVVGPNGTAHKRAGPDLPGPLYGHCTVMLNESTIFVIGGFDAFHHPWRVGNTPLNRTHFYSTKSGSWFNGPDLHAGMGNSLSASGTLLSGNQFGCSAKTTAVGNNVIVAAVGILPDKDTITMEVFDQSRSIWIKGPDLACETGERSWTTLDILASRDENDSFEFHVFVLGCQGGDKVYGLDLDLDMMDRWRWTVLFVLEKVQLVKGRAPLNSFLAHQDNAEFVHGAMPIAPIPKNLDLILHERRTPYHTKWENDKILVAGGYYGTDLQPEVINVGINMTCRLKSIVINRTIQNGDYEYGGSLTFNGYQDRVLLFCGFVDTFFKDDFDYKCLAIDIVDNRTTSIGIEEERLKAAAIIWNNSLWITGGRTISERTGSETLLKSTVLIDAYLNVTSGPDLPSAMSRHCLLKIGGVAILTGGQTEFTYRSNKTFLLQLRDSNKGWIPGPDLLKGRSGHSCGVLQDSTFHSKQIFVAAGGYVEKTTELLVLANVNENDSVVINVTGLEWMVGPDLPYDLRGASLVTTSDGRNLILLGGHSGTINGEVPTMFKMGCSMLECKWQIMIESLARPRSQFTALIIPDSLTECVNHHPTDWFGIIAFLTVLCISFVYCFIEKDFVLVSWMI